MFMIGQKIVPYPQDSSQTSVDNGNRNDSKTAIIEIDETNRQHYLRQFGTIIGIIVFVYINLNDRRNIF
jgi:hypothetical protein